jgi:hypothetical protein
MGGGQPDAETAILARNLLPLASCYKPRHRPSGRGAERKWHGYDSIYASK